MQAQQVKSCNVTPLPVLSVLSGRGGLSNSAPSSAPDLLWSLGRPFGLSLSLILQLHNEELRSTFQAHKLNVKSLKGPQWAVSYWLPVCNPETKQCVSVPILREYGAGAH